jgi:hypothetical protein
MIESHLGQFMVDFTMVFNAYTDHSIFAAFINIVIEYGASPPANYQGNADDSA